MQKLSAVFLAALLGAVTSAAWAADPASPFLDLSKYHGKVVYLDFWASWCKPCRHSFPWMNAMEQKYGADGLVIVAVNLDEQRADAERFLHDVPAGFPIVYDPQGMLAKQYSLIGMPSSLLIGRNGVVVKRHEGFFDSSPAEYETELRALLSQH